MKTLRACPFCGGKAHLDFAKGGNVIYTRDDGTVGCTPMLYRVFCEYCSCSTSATESTDVAIKLWNRRANDEESI